MHVRSTLTILVLLASMVTVASAQDTRFSDQRFDITWKVRGNAPAFRFDGEVTNRQPIDVSNIVLAVESLDANGLVTSSAVGFIDGTVGGNSSRTFSFKCSITGDSKNLRLRPVSWQSNKGL
jgi:hypothetical protein